MAVEDFIFMKLDICKAFDSLEWDFLFVVLESFGFGPVFINYIRASIVGATSSVLLNGQSTAPFPISRSIRQGCPLSALLFVVVMDVLSNMISSATADGHMHGVNFLELDYHIGHGIYADDIHLILEDHQQDIDFCFDLFGRFGKTSGLVCDRHKTCVVYLSEEVISQHLLQLGWTWVDGITATKLLGIHIAGEIVLGLMQEQL